MADLSPEQTNWLRTLLDDLFLRLSALFTMAMVLMPPEGIGVDLCLAQYLTHAPCPGCGVTRCGSNLVRGHFTRALQYHPLGPLFLPVVAALGLLGVMPRRWRTAWRRRLLGQAARLRPWFWAGLGLFVIFGLVRWLCVLVGLAEFPSNWP